MKKIISSVLVCVMLFALLVPCGFASQQTAYGDKIVFYSNNVVTNPGEDFVFEVNVRDNPGIAAYIILLEYDNSLLDVTSAVEGERFIMDKTVIPGSVTNNEYYSENTVFAMNVYVDNIFEDGNVFDFRFTVKEDAPATKTAIKVILRELVHVDDNGGTYDVFDLFDDARPSYEASVLIGMNEEIAPVSEAEFKCLTEAEFIATYEERLAAIEAAKPTPRPITPVKTPEPEKSPEPEKTPEKENGGGFKDSESTGGNSTLKMPEVILNKSVKGYMAPTGDKLFEPDRNATRYEIVSALDKIFTVENAEDKDEFSDVSQEYKKAVNDFAQVGIINGYEDKTFGGEKSITRAEFVKLLTTAFKVDYSSAENDGLSDISGHWAEKYIKAFVGEGYILGYPDGTFKPDNNITRAEAAAVLNRVLKIENSSAKEEMFSDLPVDHWAYPIITAIFE